ncbi:MAG: beta strand repeat-containing protein [Sulfurimonas sp.]|uniref:beta strand repeat-containing protein n=1 Tax=Sulfurimonas sp. TaxID=2022749 RepID=UPI003D11649A
MDETFTLTTGVTNEIHNGTAKNDLFDASELGSLQDNDILLDTSTSDADILNASVNSSAIKARIQNVETMNITGEYVKTGFDLTNVSNTQVANFDTKIVGGTATITGANSLNVAKIVAGSNISTLDITSLASGTRDTVTVDAGSASTLKLTGQAAGVDSYSATVAADSAATLTTLNSAGDTITLNVAGDIDLTSANGTELDITINATEDSVVELQNNVSVNAEKIFITGDKDVTLSVTDGVALAGVAGTGTIISDTSTGTSTIKVTGSLTTAVLSEAAVDVVEVAKAVTGAAALTLNNNTKLNLSADAAGTSLTVGLNDNDDDTTFTTGTLRVDVSEAQSTIIATTTSVDTVIVTATPDEVIDLDLDKNGTNETSMTVADLQLLEETDVAMVQGAENLTLSAFTVEEAAVGAAEYVLSAASMTGDLTVSSVAITAGVGTVGKVTIVGGAGNDNITTTVANKFDVQSGAGNDIIDITAAAAGTVVKAGAGNDKVTASALAATIDLGAGDDTITLDENDTVTLGDGTDTVKLTAITTAAANNTITDFVKGTDVLEFNAAVLNAKFDVTDITAPTAGAYTFASNATLSYTAILKNGGSALTATNFADSIKLTGVTLAAGVNNVLGDLSDSVKVATATAVTVTTGAGSDSVEIAKGAVATTKATVKDFTVGSDKIVLTGAIVADASVNLKNVSDVSGLYTVGNTTAGHTFVLENGGTNISTDNDLTSIVQLGTATAAFAVSNAATGSVNVTGGTFDDYVSLTGAGSALTTDRATFTFSNNGGVDTITLATGAGEELLNFNSLTGISTAAGATSKVDLTSTDSKVADAKDGAVYTFDDSAAGIAGAKITTMVEDLNNGYTQAVIDDEVAAFINAGLGVQDGEKYVVIINDNSTTAYGATAYGTGTEVNNAYAYLVTGDADGVQADDITLIGQIIDTTGVDSTDIA